MHPACACKGVLLGPMMLALLSVAANLHAQLVNEPKVAGPRSDEGHQPMDSER